MPRLLATCPLSIAFSQFYIHDASAKVLGLEWTERHSRQGFARQSSTVAVGALISHGRATLRVFLGRPADLTGYQRALSVPLELVSAELAFSNPEYSEDDFHRVAVEPGHYRVIIAQKAGQDREEDVDVFLERQEKALTRSEIMVADDELAPELPLLEHARAAYP